MAQQAAEPALGQVGRPENHKQEKKKSRLVSKPSDKLTSDTKPPTMICVEPKLSRRGKKEKQADEDACKQADGQRSRNDG